LELVRQPRADGRDAGADMIELGGQVGELFLDQRRALVGLERDFASPTLGRTDHFSRAIVGLLLGPIERI
jgi:hypothetical protein